MPPSPTTMSRRGFLIAALGGLAAACAPAHPAGGLPRQLVWSTFTSGSSMYNDLAAVANSLTARTGTRVRILPAATGVSRLSALFAGVCHYARVGEEYAFAFEGSEEFASEHWGPRPVRLVWTPGNVFGLLVLRSSGIDRIEDLKGRRVAWPLAGSSTRRKIALLLRTAGLSAEDVRLVEITEKGLVDGIKAGQIDAFYTVVTGPRIEDLNSERPVRWLPVDGYPDDAYAHWPLEAPMAAAEPADRGVGLKDGEAPVLMRYALPLVAAPERPVDEVAALCRALDENAEHYASASADADLFTPENLVLWPFVAPYHPGAVAYLEETGRWEPRFRERQAELLEREALLAEEWPLFLERHGGAPDLQERWGEWKRSRLPQPAA